MRRAPRRPNSQLYFALLLGATGYAARNTQTQPFLAEAQVQTRYIDPGKPWQNGHVESFHAVLRDGCLDRWLFLSLREARALMTAWLHEYNRERPHGALKGLTPTAFAERYASRKGVDYATQLAYP